MLGRTIVAALLAAACGAATPHTNTTLSLPVQRFQLTNGMTVVLVPDESATMVTMDVRYAVGSVDDPLHQEGVAHLAAHLMNDQRLGETTLAAQLERIAIEQRIDPRSTWTSFSARFAPENLDAALKLEAVRLDARCRYIDNTTFVAERANVAEELSTHVSWRLNRLVGQGIYPNDDPMFRAYAADAASVSAISREQACAFIDRRYAPGNATIVVSGPITQAALEKAATLLAVVPARTFDPAAKMSARALPATMTSIAADVPAPVVAVVWATPLEEGERNRFAILVRQVGLIVHAEMFNDGHLLGLWLPMHGQTVNSCLEAISKALDRSIDTLSARTQVAADSSALRPQVETFEHTRDSFLTEDFTMLDETFSRVREIAGSHDIGSMLASDATISRAALTKTLQSRLAESMARIVVIQPDATRPPTRSGNLDEPFHGAGRLLALDPASESVQPHLPLSVLAHARSTTLANGMTVILAPSSTIPLVEMHLVFPAGIAASQLRRVASAAMDALMRSVFRSSNVTGNLQHWHTRLDYSELSVSLQARSVEEQLGWFRNLATAWDRFHNKAERALTTTQDSSTSYDAGTERGDQFREHIYGPHPYGAPLANDAPDRVPTVADVEAYGRRFLQPSKATLILTGGFDPDALLPAIRRSFEEWQGIGEVPSIEAPRPHPGAVLASDEPLPSLDLSIGWLAGPADADYATRHIIAEMIDRLTPRARGRYSPHRVAGDFSVTGTFDLATAASEIAKLRDSISALGDGSAASRQLFAMARREVAIRMAAGPASSSDWAAALVLCVSLGHDLAWRQQLAQHAAAVEYDDVKRVLAAELSPDAATWMLSGPRDSITEVYARLGLSQRQTDDSTLRPSASRPQNVAPQMLELSRIGGSKLIEPDADTKIAIQTSNKNRVVGTFKFCLDSDGAMGAVSIMTSTGFPAYDQTIMSRIRDEWRYRPYVVDGKAVPVCTAVTFIYTP